MKISVKVKNHIETSKNLLRWHLNTLGLKNLSPSIKVFSIVVCFSIVVVCSMSQWIFVWVVCVKLRVKDWVLVKPA